MMRPVFTPQEMQAVDAAAPEPVDVLIRRAAGHVARHAVAMMGGTYGRRVVVLAGPGNNGADGRVAAIELERRGVRVAVVDVGTSPAVLPRCDLVIDAAYGTGLSRPFTPPEHRGDAVLAVDIPSGVDGLTGEPMGRPWTADRTVTFAALKPGHLLNAGPGLCGDVRVADIGLKLGEVRTHYVEPADAAMLATGQPVDGHKWRRGVLAVAGSTPMRGAARLLADAAFRCGASYVRVESAADEVDPLLPSEAVAGLLTGDWVTPLRAQHERFAAVVVGPGLGRDAELGGHVRSFLAQVRRPTVIDGDGLAMVGTEVRAVVAGIDAPVVLTPHDGEFEHLTGARPGADRVGAARELAVSSGAVVVLKGPTTVVAAPDGRVRLITAGTADLATAGTGDVLAGMVAAALGTGLDPLDAAAAAAVLHASAGATLGRGLRAGDLPAEISRLRRQLAEVQAGQAR